MINLPTLFSIRLKPKNERAPWLESFLLLARRVAPGLSKRYQKQPLWRMFRKTHARVFSIDRNAIFSNTNTKWTVYVGLTFSVDILERIRVKTEARSPMKPAPIPLPIPILKPYTIVSTCALRPYKRPSVYMLWQLQGFSSFEAFIIYIILTRMITFRATCLLGCMLSGWVVDATSR